jgi:hypothetical protein
VHPGCAEEEEVDQVAEEVKETNVQEAGGDRGEEARLAGFEGEGIEEIGPLREGVGPDVDKQIRGDEEGRDESPPVAGDIGANG